MLSLDFVHLCSVPLAVGSIIEPGNWGRIIKLMGERHNLWLREMMLEDARDRIAPDLPSRLESAFMCPTVEAARLFNQECFSNGALAVSFHLAYRVKMLEPEAPTALCLWRDVNVSAGEFWSRSWAANYWNRATLLQEYASTHDINFREVLTLSKIRIEERISL